MRGIDERPVDPSEDRKSVGTEDTFETDVRQYEALQRVLGGIADRTAVRLAGQGLVGRTVTLKVKFADFRQLTRRVTLPVAVSSAEDLAAVAARLLTRELLGERAVRLLGVSVSALQEAGRVEVQPALFTVS